MTVITRYIVNDIFNLGTQLCEFPEYAPIEEYGQSRLELSKVFLIRIALPQTFGRDSSMEFWKTESHSGWRVALIIPKIPEWKPDSAMHSRNQDWPIPCAT